MSAKPPITDAVQAAIFYAKFTNANFSEYNWACDKIQREINDVDRDQVCPQLAAAARILADEVERLRAGQQNAVLSDCCEATAVIAGKPGSTQWYACPECYEPCDVFIRTTTTQPE